MNAMARLSDPQLCDPDQGKTSSSQSSSLVQCQKGAYWSCCQAIDISKIDAKTWKKKHTVRLLIRLGGWGSDFLDGNIYINNAIVCTLTYAHSFTQQMITLRALTLYYVTFDTAITCSKWGFVSFSLNWWGKNPSVYWVVGWFFFLHIIIFWNNFEVDFKVTKLHSSSLRTDFSVSVPPDFISANRYIQW